MHISVKGIHEDPANECLINAIGRHSETPRTGKWIILISQSKCVHSFTAPSLVKLLTLCASRSAMLKDGKSFMVVRG